MSVSEFSDGSDGIKSGVLAECVWNDLQSLCESLEAVCVGAGQRVGVQHELSRYLGFGRPASSDQETFLHQATNYTKGIMKRPKYQEY